MKPDFFKHSELYQAEVEAGLPLRLAFEGLWTVADREGRFVWKPVELKLDVLPYDPVDFGAVLSALEGRGFVRSYVVAGKRYGVIDTLREHQTFHKHEAQSRLPAPPMSVDAETLLGADGECPPVSVSVSTSVSSTAIPSPAAPALEKASRPPRVTWLTPYWDAWRARYGADPHAGQLTKHLKRPRDALGDAECLARWWRYLDATEAAFVSPAKFAATHGSYAGLSPMDALIAREKAKEQCA